MSTRASKWRFEVIGTVTDIVIDKYRRVLTADKTKPFLMNAEHSQSSLSTEYYVLKLSVLESHSPDTVLEQSTSQIRVTRFTIYSLSAEFPFLPSCTFLALL